MRAKHEAALQDQKANHLKEMEDLKAAHARQTEELNKKHADTVAALTSEKDAAIAKVEKELAAETEKLKIEEQKLSHLKSEAEKLRSLLAEAERKLAAADELQRRIKAEHAEALQKQEFTFNQEHHLLKEQHKADTERLLETHLRETTEMNDQFERARRLQEQQIEMLQQRLQELQDLYDNRPSREEDLEKIIQLEQDLREKEAAYKRMYDEMQFYKLELVNREQNYNKVFGASPQVGVVNPLAKKGSTPNGNNGNTPMRVVQNGNGGGLGGMGALNVGPPLVPGAKDGKKSLQKRPSSNNMMHSGDRC
jgi:chromosome segregation ATPase